MSEQKLISKQAWMAAEETQTVMCALLDNDGAARFAGGCVRDALANRKTTDIDIATPLKPEKVIERLEHHHIKYAPTGLKHGTVTAIVNGTPFEITTLRIDKISYGRHADVSFTDDWQQDAARRDFTINAMYADIDGHLYDYFGGVEDLRLQKVRFVGDPEKRIEEDILRILRFFRFHAHFGGTMLDKEALSACEKYAHKLPSLSAERVRHEILRLLESDNCPGVWRAMLNSGIIAQLLPEAMRVDALTRLVPLEDRLHSKAFSLRRLAVLLDITPDSLNTFSESLRLSNIEKNHLQLMVKSQSRVSTHMSEKEIRALTYKVGHDMARNFLLIYAARQDDVGNLDALYAAATKFKAPRFPVTGQDIVAQGIPSGPDVGLILEALEEWWIGQDFVPGRTACLEKLRDFTQTGA